MKLQNLYNEYLELKKITEKYDVLLDTDYSEEIEEKWDEAYKNEYNKFQEVIEEIKKLTNVTSEVANKMLHSDNFVKLMNLKII